MGRRTRSSRSPSAVCWIWCKGPLLKQNHVLLWWSASCVTASKETVSNDSITCPGAAEMCSVGAAQARTSKTPRNLGCPDPIDPKASEAESRLQWGGAGPTCRLQLLTMESGLCTQVPGTHRAVLKVTVLLVTPSETSLLRALSTSVSVTLCQLLAECQGWQATWWPSLVTLHTVITGTGGGSHFRWLHSIWEWVGNGAGAQDEECRCRAVLALIW